MEMSKFPLSFQKAKLAPSQATTVPRLELCTAVLVDLVLEIKD